MPLLRSKVWVVAALSVPKERRGLDLAFQVSSNRRTNNWYDPPVRSVVPTTRCHF